MAHPAVIDRLADIAGRDDPEVCRLAETAERYPESSDTVERLLRAICREKGIDPANPPVFRVPDELPDGGRLVGHAMLRDAPSGSFRLGRRHLGGNLAFLGVTGCGKSSLVGHAAEGWIEDGLSVVFLDVADEYGWLIRRFPPEKLLVVSARNFPLALFGNPPGSCFTDPVWVSLVVSALREACFLRDGSTNLATKVIGDMMAERAAKGSAPAHPLLTEVFQRLVVAKFSATSRHAGFLETLVNRFQGILQSFACFNAKRSPSAKQVLDRSLIVRMPDLSPGELEVFGSVFPLWVMAGLQGELRPETRAVLVVEEAHLLASRQKMFRYDLGEPLLLRVMRTCRKFGMAVCVVDQTPSELPPAVLGNVATKVVFRLTNPQCLRAMSSSMGLGFEEMAEMGELPRRRAIVQSSDLPKPFLLQVVELERHDRPAPDELAERERASLELLDYEPGGVDVAGLLFGGRVPKRAQPHGDAPLGGDARKVMERLLQFPYELLEERCEALGMPRAREYKERRSLQKLGMVELGDTVGAKNQVWIPTQKGVAWGEKQGLPVHRYKSGIAHEVMVRRVRASLGRFSTRVAFIAAGEGLGVGQVQPDLLARVGAKDGDTSRRVAVQICCGNKPDDEARSAVKLASTGFLEMVLVVAKNKRLAGTIERKVEEMREGGADGGAGDGESAGGDKRMAEGGGGAEEGGEKGNRSPAHETDVRVLDFETVVTPGYDWGFVLG